MCDDPKEAALLSAELLFSLHANEVRTTDSFVSRRTDLSLNDHKTMHSTLLDELQERSQGV